MQAKLGKFSLNKVAEAMLGGAIKNDTDYTRQQILTADTILGKDIAYKKGVHTQKQQYKESNEDDATTNHLTLEIDIIYDENLSMLAGVALPTSWTVLIQIKDKTAETLLHNIQKMLALFEVMGKKVTHIRVDGEKGVVSPATKEKLLLDNKVTVDNSGKKNHSIQTLDRKVRTLKDHVRAIRNLVPFAVGGIMLMALFLQMTNIINIIPTRGNHNNLSPFQAMLGRNARMEDICPHKPLETVLVSKHNDVTNNTSNENMTESVFLYATNIHLMPTGKPEFEYLTVNTLEKITRGEGDQFKILPDHIESINRLAASPSSLLFCPSFQKYKNRRKKGRPRKATEETKINDIDYTMSQGGDMLGFKEIIEQYENSPLRTPIRDPKIDPSSPTLGELLQSAPILGRKRGRDEPIEPPHVSRDMFQEELAASFVNKKDTDINRCMTVEGDGSVKYQFFHMAEGKIKGHEPIYTACISYKDLKCGEEMFSFAAHTSIGKALKLYPEVALKSLTDEIDGMLDRKVWKGVLYDSLTAKQKKSVLFSSTITKEKYDLDGNFITVKSRIVTGGDGQNIEDIPERLRSAPTTATSSVSTIASIAAANNMEIATIDIKQAYLNADMESDVFMWITQPVADVLCQRDPMFLPFLHDNGRVLVKLLKAQYGCVESARLWYNHISTALKDSGFETNPFDPCVFQKKLTKDTLI